MGGGEEEYYGPTGKIQWLSGTTSWLRGNHHHIEAEEQPILYIRVCTALGYIQSMKDFLLHHINSYRMPKIRDILLLTSLKPRRAYCILPWPAPNSFSVHEMQLDFSELLRRKKNRE